LNRLHQTERALHEVDHDWNGFQWIDFNDAHHSVIAFLRKAKDSAEQIVCICNFTPVPRYDYRVGVPQDGYYREILNTDSTAYGGSNLGNSGGVHSTTMPSHGHPHSLVVTLPPLAVLFLKRI